jgi:hypothetical protein
LLSFRIGTIVPRAAMFPQGCLRPKGFRAMNSEEKGPQLEPLGKRLSPWRSSLYEEPVWVSLVWIIGPLAVAAVGVFLAMR